VAGAGVDGLHVTAVPLAGPGVEQDPRARQLRGGVGVEHGQVPGAQGDVSLGHDDVPRLRPASTLDPSGETAVEDADVVVAAPPQQPPRTRRGQSPDRVVDDDRDA
jgi:hypothetical protein